MRMIGDSKASHARWTLGVGAAVVALGAFAGGGIRRSGPVLSGFPVGHRLTAVVVGALLTLSAFSSPARAESEGIGEPQPHLTVTASPLGGEGTKVVSVSVSGEDPDYGYYGDASLALSVALEPASSPCPGSAPSEVVWEVEVDALHFTKTTELAAVPYGSWHVCAYLPYEAVSSGEEMLEKGEATFAVPAPRPVHIESFKVVAHPVAGKLADATVRRPGATYLEIEVPGEPFGLTYRGTLQRGHWRRAFHGIVEDSGAPAVNWSCGHPGRWYRYEVTVTDAYGKSLTQHGRFRTGSARYCSALRKAEARRQRQRQREAEQHHREAGETRNRIAREKRAQRQDCERTLRGAVQEQGTVGGAAVTICYAEGGRFVRLEGDPPRVVDVG